MTKWRGEGKRREMEGRTVRGTNEEKEEVEVERGKSEVKRGEMMKK